MPLPAEAYEKLEELRDACGEYALFGIFLNPQTGEMGTMSSHAFEPGKVLGFLDNAVKTMLKAAKTGELQMVGGDYATSLPETKSGGNTLVN